VNKSISNLRISITFILIGVFSGLHAQVTASQDIFVTQHLLPLMERAQNSIDSNPNFYPHGMGLDPLLEVVGYIKDNEIMQKFKHVSLGVSWSELDTSTKELFFDLVGDQKDYVEDRYSYGEYQHDISISEIWRVSRANPDLDVMCCGEYCSFKFWFDANPNRTRLSLNAYELSKKCVLSFGGRGLPSGYPYSKRLNDPGCSGNIDSTLGGKPEIDQAFKEAYKKLLRSLDPVATYERSDKSGCDR
jgi:hypothetical protein